MHYRTMASVAPLNYLGANVLDEFTPFDTSGQKRCGCHNPSGFHALGAVLVAVLPLVGACSTTMPAREFDRQAMELSLLRAEVAGRGFTHIVYANGKSPGANGLNVYIGSDGTPWNGNRPSEDPTPRNPLALRLMASDPGAAIYLGRPCYHGAADSAGCGARLWTSGRYSREVIDSMEAALKRHLSSHDVGSVRLIGYSGGGCIAALLAKRVPEADSLVTIAANLDIVAWADYFAYLPLVDSLNPADLPRLEPQLRQLHLVGSRDRNVPPQTIERFRNVQSTAEFRFFDDFDHVCCWESEWPKLAAWFADEAVE